MLGGNFDVTIVAAEVFSDSKRNVGVLFLVWILRKLSTLEVLDIKMDRKALRFA